jgi:CRISPR-associated protein Cas1
MIKRTIEISGFKRYLSIKDRQLVIKEDDAIIGQVPAEDIGILIIDTPTATYSHSTITLLLEQGAVIVFCGKDHLPVGMLTPLSANALTTKRLSLQLEMKAPLKKQLWKRIVQAKIKAQADLLTDETAKNKLKILADKVKSGDPENREAQAARIYWQKLLGKNFRRDRYGEPPNNLLNYGYMALRAAVGRALVGSGLHPSLGLHHKNQYNPYCLADDLMEPLRPLVDACVLEIIQQESWEGKIEKFEKKKLLELLTVPISTGNKSGPLLVALEFYTSSLFKAIETNADALQIPGIFTDKKGEKES